MEKSQFPKYDKLYDPICIMFLKQIIEMDQRLVAED